jgi:hypothetical protein
MTTLRGPVTLMPAAVIRASNLDSPSEVLPLLIPGLIKGIVARGGVGVNRFRQGKSIRTNFGAIFAKPIDTRAVTVYTLGA